MLDKNRIKDFIKSELWYEQDKDLVDFKAEKIANFVEKLVGKDLEILQMLKKHIVGVKTELNDGNKEYYVKLVEDIEQNYGDVYLFINEEEYKKVKEWLINDRT